MEGREGKAAEAARLRGEMAASALAFLSGAGLQSEGPILAGFLANWGSFVLVVRVRRDY